MARNREFDEDAVLTAAMRAFRRDGYGGVSIKALEQATGLSSGSLYNGFGDKDALFARALGHYNKTVVRRRIAEHVEGKPPIEGMRSLFLSLLDEPAGSADGCLLTNSAIEFGAGQSAAHDGVEEGLRLLEDAFRTALGRLGGEAARRRSLPLGLLALYQGVLVLIRLGRPKEELAQLIEDEFAHLPGNGDA